MADDPQAPLRALLDDLVTLVSHELRQPLMVIHGYLSLIEDGALGDVPAEIAGILPTLLTKVDEINAMIEQAVTAARLEAGTLPATPMPVDLRTVVEAAVRRLGEPPAGHTLSVELPAAPVPVCVDTGHIERALGNLLSNAVRFSPDGGELSVVLSTAASRARIEVRDQGIGISSDELASLFVRLGRVHSERTRGIAGAGLGLVNARGLARRLGGDVEAVSEPGRGSVFTLELPLTEG